MSKPNLNNQSNEEKDRKPYSFETTLPSINQNNFFYSESKSNSSETKSSFSSYFDLEYLQKSNLKFEDTEVEKNNSNNNLKRLSFDEAQNKPEEVKKESHDDNHFSDEFQKEENFEHTSSEKSDDDLKGIDETVSWLEFHEKFNQDSVEIKVEKFRKSDDNQTKIALSRNDSLPYDKKSALLSALREIDLENNENPTKVTSSKLSKSDEKSDRKIVKNGKPVVDMKSLKASF